MQLINIYENILQEKIVGGKVSQDIFKDLLKEPTIKDIIEELNKKTSVDSIFKKLHTNINEETYIGLTFEEVYDNSFIKELFKTVIKYADKDDTIQSQYNDKLKLRVIFKLEIINTTNLKTHLKLRNDAKFYSSAPKIENDELIITGRVEFSEKILKNKNEFVAVLRHEFQHLIQLIFIRMLKTRYTHMIKNDDKNKNTNNNKNDTADIDYKHEDSPIEYDARLAEFSVFIRERDAENLFNSKEDGFINSYDTMKYSMYVEYFKDFNKQQFYTKLYQLECTNDDIVWFKKELIKHINDTIKDIKVDTWNNREYIDSPNRHIKGFIIDLMLRGQPFNKFMKDVLSINIKTSIDNKINKLYYIAVVDALNEDYEYRTNKYTMKQFIGLIRKDSELMKNIEIQKLIKNII